MDENELKTLKDITIANEFDRNKFSVRNGIIKVYQDVDLRQEAIKWIKELNKRIGNQEDKNDKKYYNANIGATGILKHIFNITDEDLK